MNTLLFIGFIGIGATAMMDLWCRLRKPLLGIPAPNYGMVGRWVGHMVHGQFYHESIASSAPIHGEHSIGWTAHYLIGIAFAALLVGIWGQSWIEHPTLIPALAVGIFTVAAPFLLMQPGMGAGLAASRTKNPNSARLQSVINHAVFGLGLYLSGWAVKLSFSL